MSGWQHEYDIPPGEFFTAVRSHRWRLEPCGMTYMVREDLGFGLVRSNEWIGNYTRFNDYAGVFRTNRELQK